MLQDILNITWPIYHKAAKVIEQTQFGEEQNRGVSNKFCVLNEIVEDDKIIR